MVRGDRRSISPRRPGRKSSNRGFFIQARTARPAITPIQALRVRESNKARPPMGAITSARVTDSEASGQARPRHARRAAMRDTPRMTRRSTSVGMRPARWAAMTTNAAPIKSAHRPSERRETRKGRVMARIRSAAMTSRIVITPEAVM